VGAGRPTRRARGCPRLCTGLALAPWTQHRSRHGGFSLAGREFRGGQFSPGADPPPARNRLRCSLVDAVGNDQIGSREPLGFVISPSVSWMVGAGGVSPGRIAVGTLGLRSCDDEHRRGGSWDQGVGWRMGRGAGQGLCGHAVRVAGSWFDGVTERCVYWWAARRGGRSGPVRRFWDRYETPIGRPRPDLA
jgi:hypothetical protein